ncbi:MAG: hypothetical protein KDC35_18620 [Acidobacteria bacterium]|nr:hypothetical protein [Acidobacteriota bacterium]
MKIGIVQMDVVWQDPEANAARLLELVSAAEPAQMLILPELWPVGFTMDKDAHKAHDFSLAVMKSLAREHNCWVLGGIPAPFEPLQQNCAIWIDPNGQEHARYAKRKLFGYGGETGSYSPGDASIVIRAEQLAFAPLICYELRFPELARSVARNIQLLIYIASWPKTRRSHWRQLLIARAIENQLFCIGVNRIGTDGRGLEYAGDSLVVDPSGTILLDPLAQEGIFVCDIDPEQVIQYRASLPFLDDMTL